MMEDTQQTTVMTMTQDELRAFVAQEVRKALGDHATLDALSEHCTRRMANQLRMQTGYSRSRYGEYRHEDLPDWVRG